MTQYEYHVETQGSSRFDNLEGFGRQLQAMLSTQTRDMVRDGWELWQIATLNDDQGDNGLILIYRRPY